MKRDRLKNDGQEVHNLEDIIDARSERTSHFAEDIDAFEYDIEIPEDIDVDEALTFPHPKRNKKETDIELMDTPNKDDVMEDESDLDMQPTDYEEDYDEAISTYATDDKDGIIEEQIHHVSWIQISDISESEEIEIMPEHLNPKECE